MNETFRIERIEGMLVISPLRNVSTLAEVSVNSEIANIKACIEEEAIESLVVDFEHISFFGSAMLEALLNVWKRISARNGEMVLCNLSETGLDILKVSRFDTVWPTRESRADAIQVAKLGEG